MSDGQCWGPGALSWLQAGRLALLRLWHTSDCLPQCAVGLPCHVLAISLDCRHRSTPRALALCPAGRRGAASCSDLTQDRTATLEEPAPQEA